MAVRSWAPLRHPSDVTTIIVGPRQAAATLMGVALLGFLAGCVEPVDPPEESPTTTTTQPMTPTPTRTPQPTPTPTATPTPSFKIANTDGDGVAVRDACDDAARISAPGQGIREGTVVEWIETGDGDCADWMYVSDPGGRETWVRSQYLEALPATPVSSRPRESTPEPASTPVVARRGDTATGWTPPPNARPNSTGDIEDCFSLWDGNLDALEDLVRPLLNDEGSMRTHETRFSRTPDRDGFHLVEMVYSANNAFGARIKAVAYGKLRIENRYCRTILTDPGF